MTREEAYDKVYDLTYQREATETEIYELVDIIYNDFESMTCENCAYKRDTDVNGNFMSNEYFCVLRARCENKDYGCNKFERKETK